MCAGENGKSEVVAPTSAPMLLRLLVPDSRLSSFVSYQMVAIPVQLKDCTPGPKYSMMKPVPPCA